MEAGSGDLHDHVVSAPVADDDRDPTLEPLRASPLSAVRKPWATQFPGANSEKQGYPWQRRPGQT